jgi:peptidyl-tRNA hydrolase, PTH2 family
MKQVILVRQDLKLSKGKCAVQVAHASVDAALTSPHSVVKKWETDGMKKSVLKVNDLKELLMYQKLARDNGIHSALISDAGRTHLEAGTVTCLGLGPEEDAKLDKVTGKLKLL